MKKGRIWASVGYPESLPKDWLNRLTETGLCIAISPLHDKDVDPTGEPKKPHYHIIFKFDGPTTHGHIKDICTDLNMVNPIKLESMKGMYRYHLHLDNPDKYQYDDRDRILLNGFDTAEVEALTTTEVNKILTELTLLVETENILEYCDLITRIIENNNLKDVAMRHTLFLNTFISSRRNKIRNQIKDIIR